MSNQLQRYAASDAYSKLVLTLLLVAAISIQPSFASRIQLATLQIRNPHLSWTAPIYSLYSDGTVIFARHDFLNNVDFPKYFNCKLNAFELQYERSLIAGLRDLKESYKIASKGEQSEILIRARPSEAEEVAVHVYGPLDLGDRRFNQILKIYQIGGTADEIPYSLLLAYHEFFQFNCKRAKPWLPAKIPCSASQVTGNKSSSRIWPRDLPILSQRKFDLSPSQFKRVAQLISAKVPFRSEGKLWKLVYNFPVPEE